MADQSNRKEYKPPLHPEYWDHRTQVFERLQAAQQDSFDAKVKEGKKIKVMVGGEVCDECHHGEGEDKKEELVEKEVEAFKVSPFDLGLELFGAKVHSMVGAQVNGQSWDMKRPLEEDCTVKFFAFGSDGGNYIFWHSAAHMLGLALEAHFAGRLCVGPPLEDGGFYYDMEMGDKVVKEEDFVSLEKTVDWLRKQNFTFERLVLSKEDALEMFKFNPFKCELIKDKVVDGTTCTAYRCGPLIDLCRGPHLPTTGKVKAFKLLKNSSAYWKAQADNASLQRVYGIAFPDKKKLKTWLKRIAEAKKRDHRVLGPQQDLFFFHDLSPGSAFFLPHGARVYRRLMAFIRGEYRKRGYEEVVSPNVFNLDLWRQSGHYANYKEHMFIFDVENAQFGMKPMNCPGHCLMFRHSKRSWRELPIRMADFGVLHRNELSGALSGLTRVRRFQQDDAHIFCRSSQIKEEALGVLEMLKFVYDCFGFEFKLEFSTRPAKFLGEIAVWDQAEKQLESVLNEFCGKYKMSWKLNAADGAFYGPKIDIQVLDALQRKHQCATVQLDFQLPIKFDLQYQTEAGLERPVIIHRAILGSVERMFAVLLEQYAGKWPLWLSPRQVMLVPVHQDAFGFAESVRDRLHNAGFYADADLSSNTLKKKIREAQLTQYNFILVVGAKEMENDTVNVRTRDNKVHGMKKVDEMIEMLHGLVKEYK